MKHALIIAALVSFAAFADVPGGNRVEGYVNGQPIPASQANTGTSGTTFLSAVTTTGASSAFSNSLGYTSHTLHVTTTGTPSYLINLQGSYDNSNWITLAATSLGTAQPVDLIASGWYPYLRANLTIFGAGSSPTLTAVYHGTTVSTNQPQLPAALDSSGFLKTHEQSSVNVTTTTAIKAATTDWGGGGGTSGGSFTSATALNTTIAVASGGSPTAFYGTAVFGLNVTGSITGGALVVECSDDNSTFYPCAAVRADSGLTDTTVALSSLTSQLYFVAMNGLRAVQLRLNPAITGAGSLAFHAIPISTPLSAIQNPSVAKTGSAVPGAGTYIAGNKAGNLTGISLDGNGNVNVNVAAGGGSGGTSSSFGAALPATGTAAGFSDGTNMQAGRVKDTDSGAGTHYTAEVILQKSASGGPVDFGTSTDPVRTDPTGTTTQPISAASLPLPSGAATDRTTAAGPVSTRLSDGAAFYDAAKTGQLPAALDGSGFLKTHEQGTATVSGTVAVSNSFALDATLTGGSQKAIVRGGAKGATSAADVTSTANGVDHQGLDVAVQGTVTVSGTVTTTPPSNASTNVAQIAGSTTATLAAGEQKVGVEGLAASGAAKSGNPVQVGAVFNTTQPTVTTGQAVEAQATARGGLIVATGADTFNATVSGTVTTTPPSNASTNVAQFGGTNVSTGTGAGGAGIPRVTVSNDSTVGLVAGSAVVGKVGIDQTTPGTTNGVQVNAALPAGTNVIGKVSIDQTTPGTTNGVQVTAALPTGANLIGSTQLADGEFGVTEAKVLSSAQAPQPKDPALVVAISPNTPIHVTNINIGGTQSLGAPTMLPGARAPTIQVRQVDLDGHSPQILPPNRQAQTTDNAIVAAPSPTPTIVCSQTTPISQTTSTRLVVGQLGKRIYICGILVVSTTAQSVSLVEGTGSTCGSTPQAALDGSLTVANGVPLAANGGWTKGSDRPLRTTQNNGTDLCLLQSGAGLVAGSVDYAIY